MRPMPKESTKSPQSDLEILFDEWIWPCGCRLQVWRQGSSMHIEPCCDPCAQMAIRVMREVYGDEVPVVYEY